MQYKFRKVLKFNYKGEEYQMFIDSFNKYAFLKIDENGKYRYPNLDVLFDFVTIFSDFNGISNIKKDGKGKIEYCSFSPKAKIGATVIALSLVFLAGCAKNNFVTFNGDSTPNITITQQSQNNDEVNIDFSTNDDEEKDWSKEPYNGSGVPDNVSEEVLNKYLNYLAPADDPNDYMFASDYQYYDLVKIKKVRDQSGYQDVFGYSDATLEDIRAALDVNPNISKEFKDFIYQYAVDLRTLCPNANLAVLRHNLETLKVLEVTQDQMNKETLSTDSAACYVRAENTIYLLQGTQLDKNSDDYIIVVHELTHAARTAVFKTADGIEVSVTFGEDYHHGTYPEEAIITNLAYALQGLGNKAVFYPMQSSYFRIIFDSVDYDYADFFNHSINYLSNKIDDVLGEKGRGTIFLIQLNCQGIARYTPYMDITFKNFQPFYETLGELYFSTHITSDMSYDEASKVFDTFYAEVTFNFENMNRKYTISEDTFLPTFEEEIEELGISNGRSLK